MRRRNSQLLAWSPVVGAAALVLVLAALVAIGRYEARTSERTELRGMAAIYAQVEPEIAKTTMYTYDAPTGITCFLYQRGGDLFALEVCFDDERRLVEAVDRRSRPPTVYTVRYDLDAAQLSIAPAAFARAKSVPYHLEYFYG